jgi:lysophospholipase L1-like esterase
MARRPGISSIMHAEVRVQRSLLLFLVLMIACAASAESRDASSPSVRPGALPAAARWVVTWAASPQSASDPLKVNGQTVREIVHTSLGGELARVRVSNAYGTGTLTVGSAHLALRSSGASIAAGSDRVLTFGGSSTVSIPPGALVVSDPVSLSVPELGDLAVSLYLPGAVSVATEHALAEETTYVSSVGDFSGASTLADASTTQSWYLLADVEVAASPGASAVVALGDSITDGYNSTVNANHRWPNYLAERLKAAGGPVRQAVVDQGISGNAVLHDFLGSNALARLDRDVLVQAGAQYLIVLEGINDIGGPALLQSPGEEVTSDQIIAGYRQIIDRAHAQGLQVVGGTLTPFEGATLTNYYSAEGEAKREAVNTWIRTSGAFDAVIDFEAAVRDPSHPTRLLPAYDSGDHLHPSDAGYKAMAAAVDLSIFGGGRK